MGKRGQLARVSSDSNGNEETRRVKELNDENAVLLRDSFFRVRQLHLKDWTKAQCGASAIEMNCGERPEVDVTSPSAVNGGGGRSAAMIEKASS